MFQDLSNLTTWISLGTFIITAVGGFFIVQTFTLQAKIMLDQQEQLKMQRKLSAIEHERYRVQFRPIFELVFVNNTDRAGGTTMHSVVHFKLKLAKNDSRNFNVEGFSTSSRLDRVSISLRASGLKLPFTNFYESEEYDLKFVLESNAALYSGEGAYLRFVLTYEDTLGNAYKHEHNIIVKGSKIQSFPEPVERVDTF
jgi:hypothetical protein